MNGTYMTVGEVAERLGITVRSIQYYDQQGILSPSAKGSQNQRLYTQHDVERLYEVVCLKFAGLSLAQIKERMAGEADGARTAAVFSDAMAETEKAFSALLRRYQMLCILSRGVAEAERDGAEPDWESMARVIGRKGEEGRYFWRLSCIYDEEASAVDGDEREPSSERDLVAAWHGIMAECVALMRAQEPLDSPRSKAVARKVVELHEEDERLAEGRGFLFLESASMANRPGNAVFGGLRQEMGDYLDRLVGAYLADAGRAEGGAAADGDPDPGRAEGAPDSGGALSDAGRSDAAHA